MPTTLRPRNITALVAATAAKSSPSPKRFLTLSTVGSSFLMLFWQSQSLIYYIEPKAYDVILVVDPFFH